MSRGYVKIVAAADAPIQDLPITVRSIYGEALYELRTDANGCSTVMSVDTPDAERAMSPEDTAPRFTLVDVETPGTVLYAPLILRNVPVFDGVTSIQPFMPEPRNGDVKRGNSDSSNNGNSRSNSGSTSAPNAARLERSLAPVFGVQLPHEQTKSPYAVTISALPDYVTVHMGSPAAEAPDLRVPFVHYIKTAVSCELYPIWPEAALEANIHCIIAVALHRLLSGHYRRMGYPFDITASAAFDPFYIHGRPVFDNISTLVDRALTVYPAMRGQRGILFTPYCNGVTSICPGLSQWGAVKLARENAGVLDILRHYFGPGVYLAAQNNGEATARRQNKTALWGAVLCAMQLSRYRPVGGV